MKHLVITTVLCAAMATAVAANPKTRLSPDQLRNDMVVSSQSAQGSATTSSGAQLLIPLLLIVVLAVAASSGGGDHYYPTYSN